MFVDEQIDEQSELSFEADNSKRGLIELDFLFELRVRRVVRAQDRQSAVGDPLQNSINVHFRAQRWIHFAVRVEILDCIVGQSDVMRANLSANFHTPFSSLANQANTSGCADVPAMNVMIAKFSE